MEPKRRHAVHEHAVDNDSDVFLRSLDEITPEELGGEIRTYKRTGSELVSYIIERSVYFFAVAVFIVCVVMLCMSLWQQFSGELYYSQVADEFSMSHLLSGKDKNKHDVAVMQGSGASSPYEMGVTQPDSGIHIENTEHNAEVEELKAQMASLKQQYPDMYGWIYVEDTVIDYPVVRGDDNEFYLDHAFTGESLSVGSIFADCTLRDYIMDNYNVVLYGHNSPIGNMFADVMKFVLDREFFDTHHIYIYTPTGLYEYEPYSISMFDYDTYYFRTGFKDGADFVSFVDEMSRDAIYKKDMTFTKNDRLLTLSTCTKTGINTKRYCLQAKLVRVIE